MQVELKFYYSDLKLKETTKYLNFNISGQYNFRTKQVKWWMNTFDWDLYFSRLKKKTKSWDQTSGKNLTSCWKVLLEKPSTFHYLTQIEYIFAKYGDKNQNEEFKKIEKTIRTINFVPLIDPVEKQMYKMNILKLQDFVMLQNILLVKNYLSQNDPGNFNKFHTTKRHIKIIYLLIN